MGVEVGAVRFLALASRCGVDFAQTLLLGRQSLHVNRADLERALAECGVRFKPEMMQEDGYAESFFQALGAKNLEAMDASGYEGADHRHDLNLPIPFELEARYSLVFDGGTTEHVFNFPTAIKNAMSMVRPGGHFVGITVANNFLGHGFYQFSPELFFRIFSPENGFETRGVFLFETRKSGLDDGVFYKVRDPARLGRRVLLENSRETFIVVLARRTEVRPIFDTWPQQSDYVTSWDAGEGNAAKLKTGGWKERTRPVRYAMKRGVHKIASVLPRPPENPYDKEAFQRVRLDESALPILNDPDK